MDGWVGGWVGPGGWVGGWMDGVGRWVGGWMIMIQNNTSKVEYAYLVVVVECVHTGGGGG